MQLNFLDTIAFIAFIALVIGVSLYASRKEDTSEDYFLAGRGLTWWLVGFSLIASNISSEHFVGQAGKGFGSAGLAVASYEWIAAITLVFVAIWFLPRFLRSGIYTMPEFLEYRYNATARAIMAVFMMVAYVVVAMATVLYSGAIALKAIFGIDVLLGIWLIGLLAGAYTIYGGLKAVVWSDLIQGIALLMGGVLVTWLGLRAVGGVAPFLSTNADKLHMILPANHVDYPWTILLVGIWVPNLFYWGLNQFITQRTLGAKSLRHGQNGIIFAALIKLVIPFIIVLPGIMAFQLAASGQLQIGAADTAYPALIKELLPVGLRGLMLAALFGAVMSSLDSMLNSASAIFTMDLYKRHFRPEAGPRRLVLVGRAMTAVFVLFGCLIAPGLANPAFKGIFNYIQMFQGFISPGIVTVFLFGLLVRRAPTPAAMAAMLLNIPIYGLLLWLLPEVAFLNHMAITFLSLVAVMAMITILRPLPQPVRFKARSGLDLTPSPFARWGGAVVVVLTITLYVVFW
jgi:SSS family solute:Na+ symporter